MKSKISFVITVWSTMLLLCMGVLLVVLGEREDRASEIENRMLQGMPEFSAKNIFSGNMSGEFEDFLSDGFFARNMLIDCSESVLGVFSIQTEEDKQLLAGGQDELQGLVDGQENPEGTLEDDPVFDPIWEPEIVEPTVPDEEMIIEEEPTETEEGLTIIPTTDTYGFAYIYKDGTLREFFRVSNNQISKTAHALNAYRSELPEDGKVFYMMIPLHDNYRPLPNSVKYAGWYSNTEDALQEQADEGVYVLNAPAILNPHLEEEIYFPLDHHWSALGAYYLCEEAMRIQGLPMTPYDEYEYRKVGTYSGWFDVMYPLQDVAAARLYNRNLEEKIPFMNYSANTYMSYVTGVIKPWTKMVTGFSTGRKALVIGDSFANVFAPYLCPYYDEVHMTDVRASYYDSISAGGWIADLMEYHGIDDVYIVMSFANDAHTATSHDRLERCLYG